MSVSKLPLHLYRLKFQPSKSQQEGNLVGVQTHPFHEVSLQLPPEKPWLQPHQQLSVQLPAQGRRSRMGTAQQAVESSGLRDRVWGMAMHHLPPLDQVPKVEALKG